MAIYRQVHISFWQDTFISELPVDERYFYLYLMTNSKTSQCGIYEINKKLAVTETGCTLVKFECLLNKFIEYKKILFDEKTNELFMLNWLKHNSMNSPKVKICILKELRSIKNKDYVSLFYKLCVKYGYTIDRLCIDWGEEPEPEPEPEPEKKDPSLEFEKFRLRYFDFLDSIDKYFDILRTTRVSGKISDSVVLQIYQEMDKHPPVVVKYACETVIYKPELHSKKENYLYGIMRNTQADEAAEKLKKNKLNTSSEYKKFSDMEE